MKYSPKESIQRRPTMSDIHELHVDPTNTAQLEAWDGDEGVYWAKNADRFDRAVSRYQRPFIDACGIGATSEILDIGCGTGKTTLDAARIAVDGSAHGVDLSSEMLDVARRRAEAEGLTNIGFEQQDVQAHPFAAESFDVALSRTGAMFFGDPAAAFTNLARALRPGGQLTLLVWQSFAENEWMREIRTAFAGGRDLPMPPPDAPGPFSLSDSTRVEGILQTAGFAKPRFQALAEPMTFGNTPEEAFDFIHGLNGWMLNGLDESSQDRANGNLRASLESHQSSDGVTYGSATWLVTATRA